MKVIDLDGFIPSDNYPGWEFRIEGTSKMTEGVLEGRNVEKGLSASTLFPLSGVASQDIDTFIKLESYLVGIAEADPELWLTKGE